MWRTRAVPGTAGERPGLPGAGAGDEAGERLVADREQVLVVLEHRPERHLHVLNVELLLAEGRQRARPVDRLGEPRRLLEVEAAQVRDERRSFRREPLGDPGNAQLHDRDLALDRRVADPVVEAAPLERVVQLARPVRGKDHVRPALRGDRAQLGNRDLEVRQHLEQERLELLVGAVDLVDQQDDVVVRLDRLEQRAPDQVHLSEELGLVDRPLLSRANVEQLAGVVPLVDRVRDVEPLVALQANQPAAERSFELVDRPERHRGRVSVLPRAPTPASPKIAAMATEALIPASPEEAVQLFGEGQGITVIAGGTIVLPDIAAGRITPARALLLHRSGLDELRSDDGVVRIGATVTVAALADGEEEVLARFARYIADREVRTSATVGGNL